MDLHEVVIADPEVIVLDQGQMGPPGRDADSPTQFTVTYAANITIDWSLGDIAEILLTGNAQLSNAGFKKKTLLVLRQGGAGGYLVTYDATFNFGSDIPGVTLSTQAGRADYLGLVFNYSSSKFDVVAFARGYQ